VTTGHGGRAPLVSCSGHLAQAFQTLRPTCWDARAWPTQRSKAVSVANNTMVFMRFIVTPLGKVACLLLTPTAASDCQRTPVRARPGQPLFEFPTVEPDALAVGALLDLDAAVVQRHQWGSTLRTVVPRHGE
jgi:hypothetical protein